MEIGAGSVGAEGNIHAQAIHREVFLRWIAVINVMSVMMTAILCAQVIKFALRLVIDSWSKNWMNYPTTRAFGQIPRG